MPSANFGATWAGFLYPEGEDDHHRPRQPVLPPLPSHPPRRLRPHIRIALRIKPCVSLASVLPDHYANLWYAACTMQLPTTTDARPMFAVDAFRQDARTPQDPRLPQRFGRPDPNMAPRPRPPHRLCPPPALGLTQDELRTTHGVQFPIMRHTRWRRTTTPTPHRLHSLQGPTGRGLPRKVVKGDPSYTLTTPEGTKVGIALGWGISVTCGKARSPATPRTTRASE